MTNNKINLLVDPNNGCNLNCMHCGLACAHLVHFTKQSIMDHDKFNEMLHTLETYISFLSLGCIREPLVHPQIKDLIRSSDKLNINNSLGLTTNGILLDNIIADMLVDSNHSWTLNVSIESPDPAKYEKIRRGAKFEIFKKNISYLSELRKKEGKDIRIIFSSVVINLNYNDFNYLFDFAELMGADGIFPMKLTPHDHNQNLVLSADEEKIFFENLLKLEERSKDSHVKLNLENLQSETSQCIEKPKRIKDFTAVMNHKGDIYPPGHRKPIGCIFKPEDLSVILNYYQIFRT